MSPPHYFDTHCHLQDPAFDVDRDAVLSRANEAGVADIVTIASNPEDAERAAALAEDQESTPRLHFTAGLHPHEASWLASDTRSNIDSWIERGAIDRAFIGTHVHGYEEFATLARDLPTRSAISSCFMPNSRASRT